MGQLFLYQSRAYKKNTITGNLQEGLYFVLKIAVWHGTSNNAVDIIISCGILMHNMEKILNEN